VKKVCGACGRAFTPTAKARYRCGPCQTRYYTTYNRTQRDPLARAVYASGAYQRARREVLEGATHCAWCRRPVSEVGKLTAGHLRPIRQDLDMATDPAGMAPQCRGCQEREKYRR